MGTLPYSKTTDFANTVVSADCERDKNKSTESFIHRIFRWNNHRNWSAAIPRIEHSWKVKRIKSRSRNQQKKNRKTNTSVVIGLRAGIPAPNGSRRWQVPVAVVDNYHRTVKWVFSLISWSYYSVNAHIQRWLNVGNRLRTRREICKTCCEKRSAKINWHNQRTHAYNRT